MKMTIGITAFNEGELLAEAWESVINQTSDNWEAVIILDGNCNKKTKQIFNSIQHPKLRKFTFPSNQGTYPCRTKAIDLAKSEWYVHLDADDLLPPNAISDINTSILSNPSAEFIYGSCEHFTTTEAQIIFPDEDPERLCFCPMFYAQAPIKTSLLKKIGGYNPKLIINADWDFWISVWEKNIIGIDTGTVLYKRRRLENSIGTYFIDKRPDIIKMIIKYHPIFFNTEKRKKIALFSVYEKLARHYSSMGDRFRARDYAKEAIVYDHSTKKLNEIFIESEMSILRYAMRRLGRLMS